MTATPRSFVASHVFFPSCITPADEVVGGDNGFKSPQNFSAQGRIIFYTRFLASMNLQRVTQGLLSLFRYVVCQS